MAVHDIPLISPLSPEGRARAAYDASLARIENNFTYHRPDAAQQGTYQAIRDEAKAFALTLVNRTPASREQSLALTALEEAVMWANAAVARNS